MNGDLVVIIAVLLGLAASWLVGFVQGSSTARDNLKVEQFKREHPDL